MHPPIFTRNSVLHTARLALAVGISVLPICANGTKRPALDSWREYQQRHASETEVEQWFATNKPGIAFVTGRVSGNLEVLDFDNYATFEAWRNHMQQDSSLASLYHQVSWGYLESTPAGGRHLLYRCESIEGNQKLASRPLSGNQSKTLIETRGEGGIIIVTPSRGKVHPSGTPYLLVRGGVSSIQTITDEQRQQLFTAARQFDESLERAAPSIARAKTPSVLPHHRNGNRPGDVFNREASWEEVLTPHGWQLLSEQDGVGYWTKHQHTHATTNYAGSDLFYVFSTSTVFEAEHGYSKFAVYTFLNHNGDFTAAARDLASQGYR